MPRPTSASTTRAERARNKAAQDLFDQAKGSAFRVLARGADPLRVLGPTLTRALIADRVLALLAELDLSTTDRTNIDLARRVHAILLEEDQ